MTIRVSKNGPYLLSGGVPLLVQTIVSDPEGTALEWRDVRRFPQREEYALCRCGKSGNKPFCDRTHIDVKFDGTETATESYLKTPEQYRGVGLDLIDYEQLCASARFCHREGGIWKLMEKTDDRKARRIAIEEAYDCPSGRLVIVDKKTNKQMEPNLEKSVVAIEDPLGGPLGPLWVRGGIAAFSADGKAYVIRNRFTLCRCGKSKNKPFCDSSHYPG